MLRLKCSHPLEGPAHRSSWSLCAAGVEFQEEGLLAEHSWSWGSLGAATAYLEFSCRVSGESVLTFRVMATRSHTVSLVFHALYSQAGADLLRKGRHQLE